ncbi:hypothetical protein [Sediminibacter sp. Hel_I_10]|uniref:hypothetical protein n=1 Tax=Sediminibacter sp. Hel_I_10 TaxID=1392490 RepID=UPI00047CDA89|nr:hypothetical protein [Sediminibacter sp. Hel_I_10]
MDLEPKVLVLPNICGVEIDLSAVATPSIQPSLQSFYNTIVQDSAPSKAYTTPSKISISESSKDSRAGQIYTHKLQLQFPSNDPLRAKRITEYLKVRYLYVKLSTGMVFFFGRNDYYQNSAPKVSHSSNEKITQVTYAYEAMLPLGFTNGSFDAQISEDIPINFYNL